LETGNKIQKLVNYLNCLNIAITLSFIVVTFLSDNGAWVQTSYGYTIIKWQLIIHLLVLFLIIFLIVNLKSKLSSLSIRNKLLTFLPFIFCFGLLITLIAQRKNEAFNNIVFKYNSNSDFWVIKKAEEFVEEFAENQNKVISFVDSVQNLHGEISFSWENSEVYLNEKTNKYSVGYSSPKIEVPNEIVDILNSFEIITIRNEQNGLKNYTIILKSYRLNGKTFNLHYIPEKNVRVRQREVSFLNSGTWRYKINDLWYIEFYDGRNG
jgi:hypothetical protein